MVNAAFAPLMSEESGTQPAYAPLTPYRAEPATQPSIVALPVPEPYGDFGRVVNWKIDESLPEAIAAFARWLVHESGWTVTEREAPDVRVPIRPRHICILFRRMNSFGRDVTRPYLRALEARHLPHVLVKGGSFNEREEVIAMRNLLGAIERPDDELTVFATLRGPVFALSDAALLEFRMTLGSLHPFRKLPDDIPDSLKEVKGALEVIKNLHRGRNRRPIAETIAMLLADDARARGLRDLADRRAGAREHHAHHGPGAALRSARRDDVVSRVRRRARSARRARRGERDADRRGRAPRACAS